VRPTLQATIALPALVVFGGCKGSDADVLARVFRRAGEKIEAAAGGSPGQFAGRLRSATSPYGLAERVQTRLRWDRHLDGASVEVESPSPGVVKLKGKAPDLAKKQRALELARATTGVTEVIDELRLPKEE
jgi:hypothetical protein